MDDNGCPRIVKLLSRSVPLNSSEQPGGLEAAAVLRVCDSVALTEAVPIVQATLVRLHLTTDHRSVGHGPGEYAAIVMPQYCGSVATQLQMSGAAVEAGGRRMVHALEHMHSKGLVHMDVKVRKDFSTLHGTMHEF